MSLPPLNDVGGMALAELGIGALPVLGIKG